MADVVAEGVVDALALAEHHTATAIVAAVVVLVNGSVAGVSVPCLSVLVVDGVVGFVVLEQGGFAFPWPDGSRGHAATFSLFVVQIRVDVYGDIFGYIVLDQRFKTVHRCDAVSADIFDKVVFDHEIGGAVGFHYFIGQFQGCEFVMLISVACGDSPSAAVFDFAVMDVDTVITGDSGLFFVVRAGDGHVDAAVIQMFVVDISLYIMDVQVIELDLMQGSVILRDDGYAGAVHTVCLVQTFIFDAWIIRNLQISDGNVLCIV